MPEKDEHLSDLERIHRIECYHCGTWYKESLEKCPNCGTPNDDYIKDLSFKVRPEDRNYED